MATKFQQRHYEEIAAIFKDDKPGDNWDANKRQQHNLLLHGFIQMFKKDNPSFKPERFLKASGDWCP